MCGNLRQNTGTNHIAFVARNCHAFIKSRNDGGCNSNSLLWVLFLNHIANISRQKYTLQAQCIYGEFEGRLYGNCNTETSSAPNGDLCTNMNNHQNPAFHSLDNFYQTSFRTTRAGLIEYHQKSKENQRGQYPLILPCCLYSFDFLSPPLVFGLILRLRCASI